MVKLNAFSNKRIFNIITTNKNRTAIAPIYTINIINPIKSAPKYINNKEHNKKTKIKYNTDCTVFFEVITNNPAVIIKKNNKKNIFFNFLYIG
jgi:hypothetical protein